MQRRESVHKAVRFPILTAVAVLLQDMEKPAVRLAMRLLQLEYPLERIFTAFPEVPHSPLLSELEPISEWVRVEASSAHWRKLPPVSRDGYVNAAERPLSAVGPVCARVTLARATEVAVEDYQLPRTASVLISSMTSHCVLCSPFVEFVHA